MGRLSRSYFVWFLRVPTVAVLAALLIASAFTSASAAPQPKPALNTNGSHGGQGSSLVAGKHVPTLASLSHAMRVDRAVVPFGLQGRAPSAQAEPGPPKPTAPAPSAPAIRSRAPRSAA